MAKRYAGPGSNNGRIAYPARETAAALRIGKPHTPRAIHDLEQHGFIVATQKGRFSWKMRHATEWRLTEFQCDVTGQIATKDFARWSPLDSECGIHNGTARYPMRT